MNHFVAWQSCPIPVLVIGKHHRLDIALLNILILAILLLHLKSGSLTESRPLMGKSELLPPLNDF